MEQRSPAWFQVRLGIPTSSDFDKIVTPKGKLSEQSAGYMNRLLAEWIMGAPIEDVATQYMDRGTELEERAFRSYEFDCGTTTKEVGFITTDDGMIGCSPDRLVCEFNGAVELKCPSAPVHVGHMINRTIDEKHKPQVQGQLYIGGFDWVDVQSYHPNFPSVIIRATRDEKYIENLAVALRSFVDVMLVCRVKLEQQYGPFQRMVIKPATDDGLDVSDDDIDFMISKGAICPDAKQTR
jgi:hypothetical protein